MKEPFPCALGVAFIVAALVSVNLVPWGLTRGHNALRIRKELVVNFSENVIV